MNKEEIKEMEHIEAQEHFAECKKCQGLIDEAIISAIKKDQEDILKKIEKKAWYWVSYAMGMTDKQKEVYFDEVIKPEIKQLLK